MHSKYIIGIDEVGRGAWAGELLIGACRAPLNWVLPGLKDSKAMTRSSRQEMSSLLHKQKEDKIIDFILISKSNNEIDSKGLAICLKEAYVESANALLKEYSDKVILDGNLNPKHVITMGLKTVNIESIIKADTKIPAVQAAAIIAKHERDSNMIKSALQFPGYDFEHNVGYHGASHIEGIKKLGFSSLHRKSFKIKL